jgi:hypothetical protein
MVRFIYLVIFFAASSTGPSKQGFRNHNILGWGMFILPTLSAYFLPSVTHIQGRYVYLLKKLRGHILTSAASYLYVKCSITADTSRGAKLPEVKTSRISL